MLIDKLIYEAKTELDDLESWLDEKLSSMSEPGGCEKFFTQEHKDLHRLAFPVNKVRLIARLGQRKKTHAHIVKDLQRRVGVDLVGRLRRVSEFADKFGDKETCVVIKSAMTQLAHV